MHRFRVGKLGSTVSSTQPARETVPSCMRCRQLKKRCSRTRPQCELCARAGTDCSLSVDITSPLQDRIRWLHAYIAQEVPEIESLPTGSELSNCSHIAPAPETGQSDGVGDENHDEANEALGDEQRLPDQESSMVDLVDAYFHHVNRAYPFIDRTRLMADRASTTLYLVMAIGCTTLERAGRLPKHSMTRFNVSYAVIVQTCLANESFDSLQTLMLLALYSLFDPNAPATCSLLAVIARQAHFLGLSRRNNTLEKASPVAAELRHRLYWSVYTLDRIVAVSVGRPCFLDTRHANIPLPSLTVDEFASCDRTTFALSLQVNRHVVQLRQIEYDILSTIHLPPSSNTHSLPPLDRKALSSRLRLQVENWYSAGCLICPPDPDNVPIHDSLCWMNARYYHLLILIYYPCASNTSSDYTELLCFTQKFLQCNSVLLQQAQLPLNRVTLCRMLPICVILIECYTRAGELSSFPAWKEITLCIEILSAFDGQWRQAHRAADIMRHFMDAACSFASISDVNRDENIVDVVKDQLTRLIKDTMGDMCCYLSVEGWDEDATGGLDIGLSQLASASQDTHPNGDDNVWEIGGAHWMEFL